MLAADTRLLALEQKVATLQAKPEVQSLQAKDRVAACRAVPGQKKNVPGQKKNVPCRGGKKSGLFCAKPGF